MWQMTMFYFFPWHKVMYPISFGTNLIKNDTYLKIRDESWKMCIHDLDVEKLETSLNYKA